MFTSEIIFGDVGEDDQVQAEVSEQGDADNVGAGGVNFANREVLIPNNTLGHPARQSQNWGKRERERERELHMRY